MNQTRTIVYPDWHPGARVLLALVGLILAIYYGVQHDTPNMLLALIILGLVI